MTIVRNLISACAMVALGAVAGCQSAGPSGPGGPVNAPDAVTGSWMSSDGVAVSTLNAGKFESKILATGEKVTTGNYTFRDQKTIDLSFYSVKSQQYTQATCLLVLANQMNCTLASGTNFTLIRKT